MGAVDQHPAILQALGDDEVDERLFLWVEPLLGEGRHLHEQLLGLRVEDRLAARAALGVGEQRLQVGRQPPPRALRERVRERRTQRPKELVVGRALGESRRVGLGVHRDAADANGHQVELEGVEEITVTVTSADARRTKVYRVHIAGAVDAGEAETTEAAAACLRGAVAVGFSLVVNEGGNIEDLVGCAQDRHVTALYALDGGAFVSYVLGAPEFVNEDFRALFADGVPALTPLTVKSDGPALPTVNSAAIDPPASVCRRSRVGSDVTTRPEASRLCSRTPLRPRTAMHGPGETTPSRSYCSSSGRRQPRRSTISSWPKCMPRCWAAMSAAPRGGRLGPIWSAGASGIASSQRISRG